MNFIRSQVLKDFQVGPCIPEVSFEWFKNAVLPRVDPKILELVCLFLEDANILRDNKWKGLAFKEPHTQKKAQRGKKMQEGEQSYEQDDEYVEDEDGENEEEDKDRENEEDNEDGEDEERGRDGHNEEERKDGEDEEKDEDGHSEEEDSKDGEDEEKDEDGHNEEEDKDEKDQEKEEEKAKPEHARAEKPHEDEFFAPLAKHFNSILRFLQDAQFSLEEEEEIKSGNLTKEREKAADDDGNEKAPIEFISEPTKALRSEGPHGRYKADIYAILKNTTEVRKKEAHHERDVVVTGEYKKAATAATRVDNVHHLVGNVNHLMGSDPTRRFTFGLTIECTDTRFWFFSRSHVFVTERLDLQEDAKHLVYFILALSSARKVELGFDPTVKRVRLRHAGKSHKAKIVYRYKVKGAWYQVIEAVSIHKARFVLGRANRVSKVKRILDLKTGALDSKTLFLKDVWIPEGAKTEADVLKIIKECADLKEEDFERYFIQVTACELIQIPSMSDPATSVDDNSSNFLRKHHLPSGLQPFTLQCSTHTHANGQGFRPWDWSVMGVQTGGTLVEAYYAVNWELRQLNREHYGNKVHCREVMEDAGVPLEKIRNWLTILECLKQVLTALNYMHLAGVVHRDISTRNILVKESNGEIICRLSDFEYGKCLDQSSADIQTGTPYFMAVEVARSANAFRPQRKEVLDPSLGYWPMMSQPTNPNQGYQHIMPRPNVPSPPFRYNCLHDVESVFWILVYFLTHARPKDEPDPVAKNNARGALIRSLFDLAHSSQGRYDLLNEPEKSSIPNTIPKRFKPMWNSAGLVWALWLSSAYRFAEESEPIGNTLYPTLYSAMQLTIEDVISQFKGVWDGEIEAQFKDTEFVTEKRKAEGTTSSSKRRKIEPEL